MVNGFLAGFMGAAMSVSSGLILAPLWRRANIDNDVIDNSTGPITFVHASISFFIAALMGLDQSLVWIMVFFLVGFVAGYFIKRNYDLT
jgi:uncharacterized membrane protein YfcA